MRWSEATICSGEDPKFPARRRTHRFQGHVQDHDDTQIRADRDLCVPCAEPVHPAAKYIPSKIILPTRTGLLCQPYKSSSRTLLLTGIMASARCDAYTVKVAGVVSFYMTAALVVRCSLSPCSPAYSPNFAADGLRVGILPPSPQEFAHDASVCRNKAVLNNSPDLPLLFLFLQLVIAVILLHAAAAVTSHVEIPKLEMDSAKKLFPVVSVNIIGLVFNTLCLRGVEASFFQVDSPRPVSWVFTLLSRLRGALFFL